ncbi:hypothetical protein GCM10027447_33260 [Glycomyces halotolerans]
MENLLYLLPVVGCVAMMVMMMKMMGGGHAEHEGHQGADEQWQTEIARLTAQADQMRAELEELRAQPQTRD